MNTQIELHRCEVRTLIRWYFQDKNWNRVSEFLKSKNVKLRADKLGADVKDQFKKGNDGTHGVWID